MSLYEERLTKDLDQMRNEITVLGTWVVQALRDAVHALLEGNTKLANETILGDKRINRKKNQINILAYAFMAVHLPSAGHLRKVASIMRIVNELERIGDYAVIIAREALQLPHPPTGPLREKMEQMARLAETALEQAMTAFNTNDVELAQKARAIASQSKDRADRAFDDLVLEGEKQEEQIRYLFDMLITLDRLKRVSDRAKNICEETSFSVTGETKKRKVYKILFLDPENNCQSQIAEAVALRNYPNSGEYSSAGRSKEANPAPGLIEFMETKGLAVSPITRQVVQPVTDNAAAYDIIVSLNGPVSDYFPSQPFRTVFLEWDVGPAPSSSAETDEHYIAIYRETTARLRDLMETLRGEEAD